MKLGFIGCGNMAKAIINAVIKENIVQSTDIYASAKDFEKLSEYALEMQINPLSDNEKVVKKSDVVLLCVKPQMFETVFSLISADDFKNKIIVSIAAGKSIKSIEKIIGSNKKIARIMPNLNATISNSVTAFCANNNCDFDDINIIKKIFLSIGNVYEIDEKDFSAFSAVACCSPAFTFMYIDSLYKTAVELGLEEKTALECAANSVIGSAELLLNSNDSPETLVKKVCSPGGTTIEGVKSLNENKFEKTVNEAVKSSYKRDLELLKK